MNTKDYVKKIALGTCVYYTAATFLVLFLYFALNLDLSGGMQALALIAILPFALCFSAANTLCLNVFDSCWNSLFNCHSIEEA